jgi:hypothetical protein
MGVPPNQLVRNPIDHGIKVKKARLPANLRMEDHLKQKVPEFLPKIVTVSGLCRLCNLIGLLKGVRHQTFKVLLQIPRTASLGISELGHDLEKAIDRL